MSDFEFKDVISSPEIPRGVCKSEKHDSLFRESCLFSISPDVKNSTLNANDGVNITDLSQLKFSPIYSPPFDDSFFDNSAINPFDSVDYSHYDRSSLLDNSDENTCHSFLKFETINEVSTDYVPKSNESPELSRENSDENEEPKDRNLSDIQKQVTPNLLLRTKIFKKKHHSCIDFPPAHWISAPVALTPNRGLVQCYSSIESEVCSLVSQVQSSNYVTTARYTPKCYIKPLDYTCSLDEIGNSSKLLNTENNLKAAVGEVRMWINKIINDDS
ncbi:hypothetical protein MN116_003930 [Schistosoma mekongi]|uniref:Uncharacterized protein n=1 Tax=Schistosoma mekongi TaxID=38744 RepID=A0AAE1ZG52_SCHME|nr:hypothetical protein MN116_003930 [Schistosoma mekongi]